MTLQTMKTPSLVQQLKDDQSEALTLKERIQKIKNPDFSFGDYRLESRASTSNLTKDIVEIEYNEREKSQINPKNDLKIRKLSDQLEEKKADKKVYKDKRKNDKELNE